MLMHRTWVLAIGVVQALVGGVCLAQAPVELGTAIAERVRAEVEAQQIVGVSVAVVEEGRVTHVRHEGWEDREQQISASDATMYRWASISKPLTAIVTMQLWEEGKLDLDCDVRVLAPQFPEQEWTISPRQLLCHQGGIVHYTNGRVVKTPRPELEGRYIDIIDALDTFKASPLVCEPGSRYSYTTHGYILLGAAAQGAAGVPYPELVQQRIASPLGMGTLRPDYQWEEIPHRAIGYRARGQAEARTMEVSTDTDVSWKLAGGGWISTVHDLALLGAGMLEHRLVKPETRELMWSRQATANGENTSYGLGFQLSRFEGAPLVSHGGSQEKSRTLLLMRPESRVAVAIMCNTEGTELGKLGRDLVGLVEGANSK
jgi:serine beta-lactamase-like protein LACTB, mitochondrial